MATTKYLQSSYPSFVTNAFNAYQPQFLDSLLNKKPLIPTTAGEQDVIQQGRDFTANPLSNPLFNSYTGALTNLLQPSEDIARRNLQDTYRQAGAGTLQSGAFATGAADLERDLYGRRADTIAKGYGEIYPAIGNRLTQQAGLEALPRAQDEKTIAFLDSLLGAKNQGTGLLTENSTGENIAQFLSPLLAAILSGKAGSTAGDIGQWILKQIGLNKDNASGTTPENVTAESPTQDNTDLSQLMAMLGIGGAGALGGFLGGGGTSGGDPTSGELNFSQASTGDAATVGAGSAATNGIGSPFPPSAPDLAGLAASGAGALFSGASGAGQAGADFAGEAGSSGLGGLAGAGAGFISKMLGAPPQAQAAISTISAALAGAGPLGIIASFAAVPIIGALTGQLNATNRDAKEEAQQYRSKLATINDQLKANQPVSADDLAYVGFNASQDNSVNTQTALAAQVLSAQEQGQALEQVPGGYIFRNVMVQPIDWGVAGQPGANARGTGGTGRALGQPFNIPQVFISQNEVDAHKSGFAGATLGGYDKQGEDPSGAWEPGSFDASWPSWIPKTAERLALEARGLGSRNFAGANDANVNDTRE